MRKIAIFGGIATTLYGLLVAIWVFTNWDAFAAMEPNAWGDFLAGSVGPLALFWVVLSFFLQGSELRNSIKSLDTQTEELKQSVLAQSNLASSANEQIKFQAQARDADLWLEIRKAELDVRNNLQKIENLLPMVKRSRLGALAARGMAKSGIKELFEGEIEKLELEVQQIEHALNKSFPLTSTDSSKANVNEAGLIYDLNANSTSLVNQLLGYIEEDRIEAERRYQESRRPNPPTKGSGFRS